MKLSSNELELIQTTLKKNITATLNRPDCDFDKAKELLEVMHKVDTLRRETWHCEKFGAYEEIAANFSPDDIPF